MFRRVRRKKDFFSAHHGYRRIRGDSRVLGKIRVRGILSCLFACCFLLSASVVLADDSLWIKGVVGEAGLQTDMRYPADFNVFSFNKIEGLGDNAVTFQDIEGPLAAGDSLILKSFRLNDDNLTDHLVAAVANGVVRFDNGGTVFGNVYYGNGGSYSAPPYQITYMPNPPQSIAEPLRGTPIDFIQAHDDLTYYSDLLSKLAPTEGWTTINGTIHFVCSGNRPLEVFEIDAEALDSPVEIWFDNLNANRPIILINVKGDHSVNISYTNIRGEGIINSRILWNFPAVKEINIKGTAFRGSLLAPWADAEVKWGSFAGTLVANNVSGSAELYHRPFEGYEELQDKIENEVLLDTVNVVGIHLASEYNDNAPTTVGIVTWSVDEIIGNVESAEIWFWKNESGATVMVAPVDMTEHYYRTLLLGMKTESEYHFQVFVTTSDGQTYTSNENTITTGLLPNGLLNMEVVIDDEEKIAPGFLISSTRQGNLSIAFILDEDGDVVWWFRTGISNIARATMSYDGKYMWLVEEQGLNPTRMQRVRMDILDSHIYSMVFGASHDVTAVDENTIAYFDYFWDFPRVYEMDIRDDGTIIETREIFDPAGLPDFNGESQLNAIHYYPELGLYSVSDRTKDIFVIDPNGNIIIRLSKVEGIDYNPGDNWNHGHQLLYDSTGIITGIVFFTNYGGRNGSAVVEYSLRQEGDGWTGEEVFRYEDEDGMLSIAFGDAQRLTNGNTMVTYSTNGVIQELANGLPVKEITFTGLLAICYSCWRPTLYGHPPY